ncbi:MAG TPA: ATP-binding cassette domain-containing protein, partial [Actinomycetota bacterium]
MSDERRTPDDDEQWRPPGRHAARDSEPAASPPDAATEPAPGRHAATEPSEEPGASWDPEVRAADEATEDEVRPRGRHATSGPEPVGAVLIQARDVRKTYRRGPEEVHALDGVSFELRAGEVVGLVGPSGSGKTTLLNLLCGWEHADSGDVRWPGSGDTPADRRPWIDLAILPQSLGLVEELSVRENIELPIRLRRERANGTSNGKEASKAEKEANAARIDDLMDALGLIKFA